MDVNSVTNGSINTGAFDIGSLVIHEKSAYQFMRYKTGAFRPQSILLHGMHGVGLLTIAQALIGKNLISLIEPKKSDGTIEHSVGTISVDTIRALYTKTATKGMEPRYIIIDDCDKMSIGAQNAFLKLLEEPPENIYFILTSHDLSQILPTIVSRVQLQFYYAVSDTQLHDMLDGLRVHDSSKRTQLLYIAPGLPAEITRLVADTDTFEAQKRLTLDARDLISGDDTIKFSLLKNYGADRIIARALIRRSIELLERTIRTGSSISTQQDLLRKLSQLLATEPYLQTNVSPRLQLLKLIV